MCYNYPKICFLHGETHQKDVDGMIPLGDMRIWISNVCLDITVQNLMCMLVLFNFFDPAG